MKVFKEEQRFTQIGLHIMLVISFIIPIILVLKKYITSDNEDNDTLIGFITVIGSVVLVYALILSLKLKTRIDEEGIHFRFIPFQFKVVFISWDEIEKAYVRKYKPMAEYGGWGIKNSKLWSKGKGIAYNVKGVIGLQLELKNGKKILIGTQKEEDVKRVLQTYINKTPWV